MQHHKVKALLFDMGGVVLNIDFNNVFRAWAKLSSLTEQQIKASFQMDQAYENHERGSINSTQYFEHIRNTLQLTGTDEQLAEGWNAIFGTEMSESFDAIDQIRHRIPAYGFTNTNAAHQQYWEYHHPRVRNTFAKLYVSSEIGLRKPDAEAFEYILNDISVKAEELLFFDDTPGNIEGAQKLGIQTVLVKDAQSVTSALAAL
ncbi:MAG: HAD-IA family hydrolase [Pseudomonadota bacterium]